jgi:hypothetical protein
LGPADRCLVFKTLLFRRAKSPKASANIPRNIRCSLDRINSPEKLNAHLDSVLHKDITQTGTFNRELDETFSALARLLFGHKQIGYTFDPQLKESLRTFVLRWQNPATGCWGQWLVDRQGRIWKMDDTAMTFHVVSDLHGDVPHLDQIARRVLQLDNVNFPAGIRFNGRYENHLNWDIVKILRAAWPTLDEPHPPASPRRNLQNAHLVPNKLLSNPARLGQAVGPDTLTNHYPQSKMTGKGHLRQ